jgi:hypothetical protein
LKEGDIMKFDIEPGRKEPAIPEKYHENGMVFDKIRVLEGEKANATIIENGKEFKLVNPKSEVESPDNF